MLQTNYSHENKTKPEKRDTQTQLIAKKKKNIRTTTLFKLRKKSIADTNMGMGG